MSKKNEIYISVDVETDGPIPGDYSMLSLGAAAFVPGCSSHIATFEINFEQLPGAFENHETMEWWKTQPEAWKICRKNPVPADFGMKAFVEWVNLHSEATSSRPVCVAYPAGFDFLFIYWYLIKFTGASPFSFSALDIKSYACAVMKKGYRQSTKRDMPRKWFGTQAHTHRAVDDAIGQGQLFMNILKDNKGT